ncbi:DUF6035 family protein [Limimaricola cinnabarinus]|uniref:DUF6035 family protein n=1 Tax=Limimaricola cinnabarinus TaxID=1125964 RepID=UPI0024920668|nr:DUF6035 family protein [Limimaricola cinnabarinus]
MLTSLPPSTPRLLDVILDCRRYPDGHMVYAASLLDPLDASDLAALRRTTTLSHVARTPAFRCVSCNGPLLVRTDSVRSSRELGGRRARFYHARNSRAVGCLFNAEMGVAPDAINARQFEGRQEGMRHEALKVGLVDVLHEDADVISVAAEQPVIADQRFRRSDMLAMLASGDRIAFEVQLASPQMATIVGRAQFYAEARIALLWVMDKAQLDASLPLQGFQDIYWPQGGTIFALDDEALAESRRAGALRLHRVTVTQVGNRLEWTSELVGLDVVQAFLGLDAPDRHPGIAADPLARALLDALAQGDSRAAGAAFALLAQSCGVDASWQGAQQDGFDRIVPVLVTLLTGRKAAPSGYADEAVAAILNNGLETPSLRDWSRVIATVGNSTIEAASRMARRSTRDKLTRNLQAIDQVSQRADALEQRWRPMVRRLFPQLPD